jgi:steroid delta-isomerase-like uncharacterized protein
MTQEDAVARSFFEAWNERNWDRGTSLIASTGQIVEVATDERFDGPDGLKTEYDKWANAFPDGRVEIRNTFGSGGWTALENRFHGTNTGSFVGPAGEIPATGKSVTFDFCTLVQVQDGKIVQLHHYHDSATIAGQLGLTPTAATASA